MVYELVARNTDSRYWDRDVRWREYTTSKKKAEAFRKIPKIQFSDSGHGIVFMSHEHKGPRKPVVREVWEHVREHLK
jgi:hypothetical protein